MEDLGLAEIAGEGDVFLIGDGLVGKHHDQIVHPGVVDGLERFRIDFGPQIDAADFGADRGMQRGDGDGHSGCSANENPMARAW